MNKAVMEFGRSMIHPESVTGKRVIEIGSMNVNGTLRSIIEPMNPESYLGIDMQAGPCVDCVCNVLEAVDRFGAGVFDLVICTEMMEHVEDWQAAVSNIKGLIVTGGLLVLTTRSPGFPIHGYPSDYWRYRGLDIKMIFGDLELLSMMEDSMDPGIFVVARKPENFVERDLSWFQLQGVR